MKLWTRRVPMLRRTVTSLISIFFTAVFLFSGCSSDDLGSFQHHDPQSIKLFELLDESPALSSLFAGVDAHEFNLKTDDLVTTDPELVVKSLRTLADTFYGDEVIFPQAMRDMADSLVSFHDTYRENPESLNTAYEVVEDILNIEASAMTGGAESLVNLMTILKNEGSSYGAWDIFSENQEFGDIGTNGIDDLIGSLDFVKELYSNAGDFSNPAEFVKNFLQTLRDDGVDVEARVQEVIDFIENPETPFDTVEATEMEVADWLAADQDKQKITDYLLNHLYPMVKEPILADAAVPDLSTLDLPDYITTEEDYRNFIKRGRWLLDDQMEYLKTSAADISTDYSSTSPSTDDTNLVKWLLEGLYHDIDYYDHLEDVDVFDFENNDLLAWLKKDIEPALNSALSLSGSGMSSGITPQRFKQIFWDGWTYYPTSGGSTTYKGLFAVGSSDPSSIHSDDGYVTRMAKTKSSDNIPKPFRRQAHDVLNGNNNGDYTDDGDSQNNGGTTVFKEINLTYNNNEAGDSGLSDFGDGAAESQVETFLTNMHLHLIADYYSPTHKKWAMTPEDGQEYFGDPNKNVQTLLGGIQTSTRNMMVLDRNGKAPGDSGYNEIPLISEMFYVMAAAYGIADPTNGPGELSVQNCLKSMGSPLGTSTYISSDTGLFTINITVMGNNDIYRKSTNGGSWVQYATQHAMPANELLQPGTFRQRWDNTGSGSTWYGKFAPSQGDLIGVADSSGKIITANWVLSEIALACWEGYGPYTYKGRAPNGSDCKYKNDYYTDWYYMKGWKNGNKGPGFGELNRSEGRYHIYEGIYRPASGETGFADSGQDSSTGADMAQYGYIRPNKTDGTYANASTVVSANNKVILECASREEAIRKNFKWLLNQKKYQYMIPIHATKTVGWWVFSADIEIYAYCTINANGVAGIASAKRYGSSISDNAKWGLTGVNSNFYQNYEDESNYFLNVVDESNNTSRFSGVSFTDQDYCLAMDYKYYVSGLFSGLAKAMVDMTDEIWGCLGSTGVLPEALAKNFAPMIQLGNAVYSSDDIISSGYSSDSSDMRKFGKFYSSYFPDADLIAHYNSGEITAEKLPAVPRVQGVTYPVSFNDNGSVSEWEEYTGDSKGKFEDILGILTAMVGSFHEDGTVHLDIDGSNPADDDDYNQVYNQGDIAYFARDGFRANLDNIVLAMAALNDMKYGSDKTPSTATYRTSWLAFLIDMDPDPNGDGSIADQTLDPGSRKGLLPEVMQSKFMNLNNIDPVKNAIEGAIQNVIRTYLNNGGNFQLSNGGTGDLEEMYLKDSEDEYILDDKGYKKINPAVDWDKPINRLRYFTDDRSLDRLSRSLDFVVDLSHDEKFVNFLRETIPTLNTYLAVKHIDQRYRDDGIRLTVQEAIDEGIFQINLDDDEPYTDENDNGQYDPGEPFTDVDFDGIRDEGTITRVVNFLDEFEYSKLIDFIKETGVNDIEKLYNFSFDHWGSVVDPEKLKEQVDDLNSKLIKYFGFNLKEGIIEGVYTLNDDIDADNDGTIDFNAGDRVYGFGKYIKSDISDYDIEDDGKYYKYLDIKDYIFTSDAHYDSRTVNSAVVSEVEWPGIKEIFIVRNDEDYDDPWYRGSLEQCPYVYSPHKYDFRLDLTMNSWNDLLLSLQSSDFTYGTQSPADMKLTYGKTNQKVYYMPDSLTDIIFGWNGSSFGGLDIEDRMNLAKDSVIDYIYDDKAIEVDDSYERIFGFETGDYIDPVKKTASIRTLVGKVKDYLSDNFFEYAYVDPDPDQRGETGELREVYMTDESIESGTGADPNFPHKHMLNNVIDIASALLHPESPNYQTGELFDAWQTFIDSANITPERLKMAREAIAALLYSENEKESFTDANGNGRWDTGEAFVDANEDGMYNDGYTRLFTKLSAHLPQLLTAFKGSYDDLVDLGLIAFGDEGIGDYMMNAMNLGEEFEAWDVTDELNTLMNQDIFRYFTYEDTFWWQMGTLMDDFATLIEAQPHYNGIDFFEETRSVFK